MPHPQIVQSGLPLRQLLPEAQILGCSDLVVRRSVRDARQVQPGDVWVAVPKPPKHLRCRVQSRKSYRLSPPSPPISSKDLCLAVARGAGAVVLQPPLNEDLPIPVVLVPDVWEAWGRICHRLASHPSKTLRVIAVTGRLATTATCWLLKQVLAQAGYRPGLVSPLGCFDGTHWKPASPEGPTPEVLAAQLARMVREQCTHAVVEVGLGDLAQKVLAGMELDGVCLSPMGLEGGLQSPVGACESSPQYFPGGRIPPGPSASQAEPLAPSACLAALQTGLFRYLKPEGLTVLSVDDPALAGCLPWLEGPVLTVGRRQMAEITARLLEADLAEQTFLLQAGADLVPVRTRCIGKEHITGCLLAAAVGLAYGMDLVQVVRALEAVETVPGQLERIVCGQPFAVFLHPAQSAHALQAGLQTLRRHCQDRLWCVAGLPLQEKKAGRMGRLLSRYVDRLVLTVEEPGCQSAVGQPPPAAEPILEAFTPPKQASWIADRGEAIFSALQQAQPGDCVVVLTRQPPPPPPIGNAPAGNEPPVWDDRAVVQACLAHLYPEELPLS